MPSVLKNILNFTGLVVGVPSALPHGLNLNGRAVVPKTAEADGAGYTITGDDTNITVTRNANAAASVNVYVDYWHSIIDAEPLPNGIATSQFPFVVQGGGSGGGGGGITALSGGTTLATGPTISFQNGNNVTFGINGNTVTMSVQTAGGTATGVGLSAGTQSAGTGAVIFSNSNNISFGMSNSSIVTASFSASVQPNPAISAAGGSASNGTIVLSNSNNVSFGWNGSTVTASASSPAETPFAISAGTQSVSTGSVVFSASNGLAFGMSGSSRITGSYSTLSFDNGGGVTFGINGSTITASAPAGGGGTGVAIAADGSTRSSGTVLFTSHASLLNNVTFSYTNGSQVVASAGFGVGAGGVTNGNFQTINFANSNGVSFGLNGATVTASVAGAGGGVALSAAGGLISSGTALIRDSNGVFWSRNGQTLDVLRVATVSGTNAESVQISASGAAMVISNANSNITMQAGSVLLMSGSFAVMAGPAAQVSGNNVSIFATNGAMVLEASVGALNLTGKTVNLSASDGDFNISAPAANRQIFLSAASGVRVNAGATLGLNATGAMGLVGSSHVTVGAVSSMALTGASMLLNANVGLMSLQANSLTYAGGGVLFSRTGGLNAFSATYAGAALGLGGGIADLQAQTLRLNSSSGDQIGFFGSNGATKQVISGASTNLSAALGSIVSSLLSALHQYGFISSNFT